MEKTVQQQLDKILSDFMDKENNVINQTFNLVGQETKEKLKETSPKETTGARRGAYAKSWTTKRTGARARGHHFGSLNVTVYNKDHYRLTHLLEHGHAVSNQYGATGHRAQAKPHIAEAEAYGNRRLLEELERNL